MRTDFGSTPSRFRAEQDWVRPDYLRARYIVRLASVGGASLASAGNEFQTLKNSMLGLVRAERMILSQVFALEHV